MKHKTPSTTNSTTRVEHQDWQNLGFGTKNTLFGIIQMGPESSIENNHLSLMPTLLKMLNVYVNPAVT